MDEDAIVEAKRRAARSAVEAVADGAVVGLGSGSTAAHAIAALGERVDRGDDLRGVPTSFAAAERARAAGIPVVSFEDVDGIDVAIDGADEVAGLDAIKGGGGAHAREKVVDAAAERLHLVVDERKVVDRLSRAVPVEVLPDARRPAAERIEALGGAATLRRADRKDGPVVTDNGNLLLDCAFGAIASPDELGSALSAVPGVVEHGLFVGVAAALHVGRPEGVAVRER